MSINKPHIISEASHADPALESKSIYDNIQLAKTKLLYKHLPFGIIGSLGCAIIAYFALTTLGFTKHLNVWFSVMCILTVLRFISLYFYSKSKMNSKLHLPIFAAGAIATALNWGILASFLMPYDYVSQMIIIVIIAGISAGASQSLQSNLAISMLYTVLTTGPLIIWLFNQEGIGYIFLTCSIGLYLLYTFSFNIRGNIIVTQLLKLQFENAVLVNDITTSNEYLKKINKHLTSHESDLNVINQLSEELRRHHNQDEMYLAIQSAAENLFAGITGAMTITTSDQKEKLVLQWGDQKILKSNFHINECYAFKTKSMHIANLKSGDKFCKHYNFIPSGNCVCIPLKNQSNIIGLLNFCIPENMIVSNYLTHIINTFAEIVLHSLISANEFDTSQSEATRDPLTNLLNKQYLNETLPRELKRAIRENNSLYFILIDIDHFKNMNTKFGYKVCDEALKTIAAVLSKNFRGSDIVCRYSGDEFVLVILNTDTQNVLSRIEALRKEIEDITLSVDGHVLPKITVSIGISEAPKQASAPQEIIQLAEKALNAAKAAGHNRIEIAN